MTVRVMFTAYKTLKLPLEWKLWNYPPSLPPEKKGKKVPEGLPLFFLFLLCSLLKTYFLFLVTSFRLTNRWQHCFTAEGRDLCTICLWSWVYCWDAVDLLAFKLIQPHLIQVLKTIKSVFSCVEIVWHFVFLNQICRMTCK